MVTPGIRVNYANLRTKGYFSKSKKVLWKRNSRYSY